jgi:small GTP-binding protein
MADDNDPDSIKIILIGDSGAGKTNLITVAAGYEFNSNSLTTRACSYIQKKYTINNSEYKVNVWDTIGQEKYRSLTKIFVKESKIVIFVYDITNRNSFESLPFWKKIVDELLSDTPVLGIVGNKMDLYVDEQIKSDEVEKYANEIGAKLLLTSAKTDSSSFSNFLEELLQDDLIKGKGEIIQSFSLDKTPKKKKKNCC